MKRISLTELRAKSGQEIGTSSWITIDQSRIDAFADVTDDSQYLHVDPDRAKNEGPFGVTIAHGYLTLSLVTSMIYEVVPQVSEFPTIVNYGINKLRFLAPVPVNSQIRGHIDLMSLKDRARGGAVAEYKVTVEIKGEDHPALVLQTLAMMT